MRAHRVIINADDLGMNPEVNSAIENAINDGCISSSSIMANAPAFDDAVRIAKQYSQISFGVHLNVDEFAPLTNHGIFYKYHIVDELGVFRKEVLHGFTTMEDDLVEAIYAEWKAQLDKVIAVGIVPSHIDSHEHTHGIVRLQDVLIRLLKEYDIKRIRRKPYTSIPEMFVNRGVKTSEEATSQNVTPIMVSQSTQKQSFIQRRLIQLRNGGVQRQWIKKMHKEGFELTDFFDSYQLFYHAYPKLLKYGHYKTIELMTHPGHPGYQIETDLLMQKKLKEVCQYELINYNDLSLVSLKKC